MTVNPLDTNYSFQAANGDSAVVEEDEDDELFDMNGDTMFILEQQLQEALQQSRNMPIVGQITLNSQQQQLQSHQQQTNSTQLPQERPLADQIAENASDLSEQVKRLRAENELIRQLKDGEVGIVRENLQKVFRYSF
jgi:hypothetical protein